MAARLAKVQCPAFAHRRDLKAGEEETTGPIVLASGSGSFVVDVDDNRYLDLAAGFGALVLGHSHQRLNAALAAQSQELVQGLGDFYASHTMLRLLETLAQLRPGNQVLLGQSGGDAITAAIKTVMLATGKADLIAFEGAYHGLGYAPLPACGFRPSFRAPFADQLGAAVSFAPYPGHGGVSTDASLAKVEAALREGSVGGVLVEPLLGRGGCVVPPGDFLQQLCALAHEHDALVIADEIWTGMGRTGALMRSLAVGAEPDLVCLGKGLGGGLPISACLAPGAIMDAWTQHGEVVHTSTHAGAPLACAAALETLAIIESEDLTTRARRVGENVRQQLSEILAGKVREVRGAGLMIGIELREASSAQRVVTALLEDGYLVTTGGVDGATLILTPPLLIEEHLLLDFGRALSQILSS